MKIYELLAELGFKVTGQQQLAGVNSGLALTEKLTTRTAIKLGVISASMIALIATSARAGMALRNFVLTTGLSSDDLQIWQQRAEANGIAADQLTNAIKSLQTAQMNFAMGEPESMGVWSRLGVSPTQDPFAVLTALRKRAGTMDTPLFRNLLGRVGLEGLLPLLKSTNVEWEKWSRTFIVTRQETEALAKLNSQWRTLKVSVEATKDQFSAVLAPAIGQIIRLLTWATSKLSDFVHWMERGTPAARFVRQALQVLVPALLWLGTTLSAAFAIGKLSPFLGGLTRMLGIWGLIALAIEDIVRGLAGGKSLTKEWGEELGTWLAKFQPVLDFFEKARKDFDQKYYYSPQNVAARSAAASTGHGASGSWTVNNDVQIDVKSTDPKAAGKEMKKAWDDYQQSALGQANAPGF